MHKVVRLSSFQRYLSISASVSYNSWPYSFDNAVTMSWALQDSSPQRKRVAQRINGPGCICPLEFLNFDFDTFGKEDHYNGEGHKHPNFRWRQLRDAL